MYESDQRGCRYILEKDRYSYILEKRRIQVDTCGGSETQITIQEKSTHGDRTEKYIKLHENHGDT